MKKGQYVQSDPDLVTPDLVTPRFSDRINFPRYKKLMAFDPDLVTPRFSDRKTFLPKMSLNRGPTVQLVWVSLIILPLYLGYLQI